MTDTHTPHAGEATLNKRFPTLAEAYHYANGLTAAGLTMQASRVFQDRIKASRHNRFLLLLGVEQGRRRLRPDRPRRHLGRRDRMPRHPL